MPNETLTSLHNRFRDKLSPANAEPEKDAWEAAVFKAAPVLERLSKEARSLGYDSGCTETKSSLTLWISDTRDQGFTLRLKWFWVDFEGDWRAGGVMETTYPYQSPKAERFVTGNLRPDHVEELIIFAFASSLSRHKLWG